MPPRPSQTTDGETSPRPAPVGQHLFKAVSSHRVSQVIVEQIRHLMREERLQPGDRLPSERELCTQFGVSRVTVREALRILESSGLVEIRVGAHGGAFVTAPSSRRVSEGLADLLTLSPLTAAQVTEARLVFELAVVPLALLGLGLESVHAGAGEWAWQLAAWCFDLSWPLFEWLAASPLSFWCLPEAAWFALPLALIGAFWLLLPRGTPGKALAALLWLPLLWPDRRVPAVGEAVLVVVEGALGFADDDGVEPALRISQCGQKFRRFRSTLPRKCPCVADIEVLGHDVAVCVGQPAGPEQLPVS